MSLASGIWDAALHGLGSGEALTWRSATGKGLMGSGALESEERAGFLCS